METKFFSFQSDFSESARKTIQGMDLATISNIWEKNIQGLDRFLKATSKNAQAKVRIYSIKEAHYLWVLKL